MNTKVIELSKTGCLYLINMNKQKWVINYLNTEWYIGGQYFLYFLELYTKILWLDFRYFSFNFGEFT